ncbi:family 2A encapsulin nanocompartment cargo protein cysteine desulfurase [Leptospira yasudae]|uniref:Cysteine desulfurase n=1 Tax=Leptospira yasudae TaxID=2202201 RepID=A0A6N4QV58_9LEPT|nr:family 2A encapsulin nanocompartment cargo protein cysteine desulfurase [Leptospira yasudae]TGL76631.1 cysteine desulfurase [Leptospira yasudae]TGL83747.1 cysteine desulfurase [Leptospira yasudae]TGL84670.1 cysteine desulfurase [Leptospira yasudae]
MSTSDFFPKFPNDSNFGESEELRGLIDPNQIVSMATELFGSLPRSGGVDELILSDLSPSESKPPVQTSAPVRTGQTFTNSYGLSLSESDLNRIPDEFLAGTGLPSFPGELNPRGILPAAPSLSSASSLPNSFSFLDDVRSFLPQTEVSNLRIEDAYSFSPSLIPNVDISSGKFDISSLKKDFPILKEKINGRDLVWLDNAATTHKPQSVIDRISKFYETENSNIHRGAHTLAARATDAYEAAREKTARFLNASSSNEIVFVRGATEAINLVAQTWGRQNIGKDDEILITWLEHHANIVPWQMLCSEKGAKLKVVPVDETGQIILNEYERLLTPRTKLVSITQVSNALGTVTPVIPMVERAHRFGAKVLVDGAQAVSHMPIDVQTLDCDFYVFSGHKVFAPTGIGVLFGKSNVLESIPPWQGGGNMIEDVRFEKTVYQPAPFRFEAGTGNIADAVGLGAAIDYLNQIGMQNVADYEHSLLEYGTSQLQRVPGLRLIGTAREKAGVLSFVLDGFKTEDVGKYLNLEGIAVRSGHHCAQPILRRFGLESTVRPSLALYNTCEDIDALVAALLNLKGGRTSGPL